MTFALSPQARTSDSAAGPGAGRARITFAVYFAVLAVLAATGIAAPAVRRVALGDLQNAGYMAGWLRELLRAAALDSALLLPIGFLAVLALPWEERRLRRFAVVVAPSIGATLAAASLLVWLGRGPALVRIWAPIAGGLLGVAMGAAWRRGPRARRLFFPKLALGALALGLLGTALGYLALEPEPLSIEVPVVSFEEKRALRQLFKGKNPLAIPPGETRLLRVSQENLDRLVAWGIAIDNNPDRKGEVRLGEDRVFLRLSLGLPTRRLQRRFANLSVGGETALDGGEIILRLESARLGAITPPLWFLNLGGRFALWAARRDERVRTLLAPLRKVVVHQQAIEVTYARVSLPKGLLSDLVRSEGATGELVPAVRAYVMDLVQESARFPDGDGRFGAALEAAFALARERSTLSDRVSENKAALLALGMALGHWRVEQSVGRVLDDAERKAMLQAFGSAALRSRRDWVRHFSVSAALVVLASEGLSFGSGVLKEELDAQGGSGFSFGDLAADRAGTAFATTAIENETSAQRLQDRLLRGFVVDDYFPPVADLPEDMQDVEFQRRFGGVGGGPYLAEVAEIDRRIAACAAYRPSAPSGTP